MSQAYKKILIIDDDKLFLKPLIRYLTLCKFQVNIANSGANGLQLNDSLKFDLIITDLKMEGVNGLQVINMVTKTHPNTKIIVVSGYVDEEEFKEIKENPFVQAILRKPVDFDELVKVIERVL